MVYHYWLAVLTILKNESQIWEELHPIYQIYEMENKIHV